LWNCVALFCFNVVGTTSLECNYQWTTNYKRYDIRGTPVLYGKFNPDNYVSRCQQKCINNSSCTGIDYVERKLSPMLAFALLGDLPWCWIVIPGSRPRKVSTPDVVHSDMTRNCPKTTTGQRPYCLSPYYCAQESHMLHSSYCVYTQGSISENTILFDIGYR